ncbi:chromosome partitioning protein [Mycobacteroides abscessus]|uniref:chromosome partitioning protein n=1 Tax=Mycobacteroides abscessus TaxID=36809 RepID=UPI00148F636B|nr:chromosome partitioning protein [Mycobacteroides abscessus]
MTTFRVTDPAAAARAAGQLATAALALRGSIEASTQALRDLEPEAPNPAHAAEALARWRRRQAQIARRENELMLVLHECGASERSLATLMHIGRPAVTARLQSARDERESATWAAQP